jgi:hypothetical protein
MHSSGSGCGLVSGCGYFKESLNQEELCFVNIY